MFYGHNGTHLTDLQDPDDEIHADRIHFKNDPKMHSLSQHAAGVRQNAITIKMRCASFETYSNLSTFSVIRGNTG